MTLTLSPSHPGAWRRLAACLARTLRRWWRQVLADCGLGPDPVFDEPPATGPGDDTSEDDASADDASDKDRR